jgi:hypothetical protein
MFGMCLYLDIKISSGYPHKKERSRYIDGASILQKQTWIKMDKYLDHGDELEVYLKREEKKNWTVSESELPISLKNTYSSRFEYITKKKVGLYVS